MRDSTVSNNTVTNGGTAGVVVYSNGCVLMERLKIQGNTTIKTGSAFSGHAAIQGFRNGTFALVSSDISGNTSADSGVVTIRASYSDRDSTGNAASPLPPVTNTVSIENVTISNNTSLSNILNLGTLRIYTVTSTTIANNAVTAGCSGGISRGLQPVLCHKRFPSTDSQHYDCQKHGLQLRNSPRLRIVYRNC